MYDTYRSLKNEYWILDIGYWYLILHIIDPLVRATHCPPSSFRFILFILFLRSYFPLYSSYPILSSLPLTPPLFLPPLQSKLILYLLSLPSLSSHLSLLSSLLIFPSPPLLFSPASHVLRVDISSKFTAHRPRSWLPKWSNSREMHHTLRSTEIYFTGRHLSRDFNGSEALCWRVLEEETC